MVERGGSPYWRARFGGREWMPGCGVTVLVGLEALAVNWWDR